ncbi:MAG: hypothetical protein KBT04_01095 [Bacteroidales bacterium]|nr:hypothetical protein [Candidatus Colimorpha onthohippi]
MKKIILTSAVAIMALAFASCSKNCTCHERNSGYSQDMGEMSKSECSDAEDDFRSEAHRQGYYNQSWTCETE